MAAGRVGEDEAGRLEKANAGDADWQPDLVVDSDPFGRAGRLLADSILEVLRDRQTARLAIPGGSALEAARVARGRLGESWSRVMLTWVDERCVPAASEDSNQGAAMRMGLLGAPVAPGAVIPLYRDEESPEGAVRRFGRSWGRDLEQAVDVALLGMGSDGHIASLFPGTPLLRYSLSDAHPDNVDCVAHVAKSPKPPANRITLTRAALDTAQRSILVAVGEEKRDALGRLLTGDRSMPAHGLVGLTVVTDLDIERRVVA